MSTNTSKHPYFCKDLAIVIPARMASQRLPGKPLCTVGGKSLLEWTYQQAKEVDPEYLLVATPDIEIMEHCNDRDMKCVLTGDHPNGTNRVAEAIETISEQLRVVVNWQVDEPLVMPNYVRDLVKNVWRSFPMSGISTLVSARIPREFSCTKVIVSSVNNNCLWFTREELPGACFHCGVYAYTLFSLQMICKYKPTELSQLESLEQLTWLEYGESIHTVWMDSLPLSINTLGDLEEFGRLLGD